MTRWLDRLDSWCERHLLVLVPTAVLVIVAAVILAGHHPP